MPLRWPEIPRTGEELALFAASCVIAPCVALVLAAVAVNFALARQAGAVRQERRSPVSTATMVLFFAGYYLLIHRRIGVIPVPSFGAQIALAAAGSALVVVGSIVNVVGRLHLGRNWADQVTLYTGQTLVTTGIFGIVRHPLYASLLWMFYGAGIAYRNGAALLATTLVFLPAMRFRARQEEALLAQQFAEYESYRRRVGMFMPHWRGGSPDVHL